MQKAQDLRTPLKCPQCAEEHLSFDESVHAHFRHFKNDEGVDIHATKTCPACAVPSTLKEWYFASPTGFEHGKKLKRERNIRILAAVGVVLSYIVFTLIRAALLYNRGQ